MSIPHLTDSTLAEFVGAASGPVVVDFWAEWCGPCKQIAPILDEIAEGHPEISVAKLDVDENIDAARRFGVMTIPTLIIFKDGEEIERLVGAKPKAALLASFLKHVG